MLKRPISFLTLVLRDWELVFNIAHKPRGKKNHMKIDDCQVWRCFN